MSFADSGYQALDRSAAVSTIPVGESTDGRPCDGSKNQAGTANWPVARAAARDWADESWLRTRC